MVTVAWLVTVLFVLVSVAVASMLEAVSGIRPQRSHGFHGTDSAGSGFDDPQHLGAELVVVPIRLQHDPE